MIEPFTNYSQLAQRFFEIFDEVKAGPEFLRACAVGRQLSALGATVEGQWRNLRTPSKVSMVEALEIEGKLFHGKGVASDWNEIAISHGGEWDDPQPTKFDPLNMKWVGQRAAGPLSDTLRALDAGICEHYTYTFGKQEAVSSAQARAIELLSLLDHDIVARNCRWRLLDHDIVARNYRCSIVARQMTREGIHQEVRIKFLKVSMGNLYIEGMEMDDLVLTNFGIHQDWDEVRQHLVYKNSSLLLDPAAPWTTRTASYLPSDEMLGISGLAIIKPEEERLQSLLENQQLEANTRTAVAVSRKQRL